MSEFTRNVLKLDLDINEIDRSHRVGKTTTSKPNRDVIVRVVSYRSKQKLLRAKKTMHAHNVNNGTSYLMFEDLTKQRAKLSFTARDLRRNEDIKDTWTFDGKIFIKLNDDTIKLCSKDSDLPNKTVRPTVRPLGSSVPDDLVGPSHASGSGAE